MNTYKLTLLALLATLAVVGRYAFQFIPNVQPVTAIIILTGIFLGPMSAVILGILVVFLSNMLLGMGIWTVWQIISWCVIGIIAGIMGITWKRVPFIFIIIFSVVSGYFYGFIISLTTYHVTGYFWPYYLAGLPFDTAHAIGNAVFITLLYPLLHALFQRYAKNRFRIKD
ncbi:MULTISPECIES: ECF transporter S component [Oceanobacillus]|uniref:ECF transporter S component n=1 Tax=Oceanobacillus TaxID=182709 RepID=UPI002116A57E|nr:ECF transporter S component [Oceanobacillus oncorhynchi]UUI38123.1 ECF transporter S component [Oceanobacillus oncorhynchi]